MDYEKKHKEEVVRATQLWENGDITREQLEYIFPELKESELEDEKIRKHLLCLFQNDYGKNSSARFAGIRVKDIIAWLEKQGQVKESIISKHEDKTCKEIDGPLTSEDEEIKKEIISYLKYLDKYCQESMPNIDKCITWIEKQSKSALEAIKEENQENNVIGTFEREIKIDAGGYPYFDCNIELYDYTKDIPLAKKGDKVKVVILRDNTKENEEL